MLQAKELFQIVDHHINRSKKKDSETPAAGAPAKVDPHHTITYVIMPFTGAVCWCACQ